VTSTGTERLENSRKRYNARLLRSILLIEKLRHDLNGENGADALHELGQIAHGLAGTGGSFGFPIISIKAQALEKAVSSDRIVDVRRTVQALQEELMRATQGAMI